ncbi:MAG: ATP synthase F1 subunit delta [Candidatus Rokubacteria bacterium]|nr:ATP synthase F1 subunit delta [Candidatus Rokubacteria bacterium]
MRAPAGVARSYAKALFALARERNETDAVAREVGTVVEVLAGEPELRAFFARPWIAAGARRAAAVEIATRLGVSPLVRDFLALVASKGRAGHFEAMAAAYRDLLDAAEGRVRARVRTAVPLTDDARSTLARRLGQTLGSTQVVLQEEVDAQLLGGFVAEIGSVIVDGSLDGQLARLRERLARG